MTTVTEQQAHFLQAQAALSQRSTVGSTQPQAEAAVAQVEIASGAMQRLEEMAKAAHISPRAYLEALLHYATSCYERPGSWEAVTEFRLDNYEDDGAADRWFQSDEKFSSRAQRALDAHLADLRGHIADEQEYLNDVAAEIATLDPIADADQIAAAQRDIESTRNSIAGLQADIDSASIEDFL